MQVLIVDDTALDRMLMRIFLNDLGFIHLTDAEDGPEALELIDSLEHLGLILVDWNMPYMTGIELIEAIRRKPGSAQVPIVMITTEIELDRVKEALLAGADEYIMKPFTLEMLRDKLNILGLTLQV